MVETKVRVNTLKVTFKRGSTEPTDAEMFQFCREQQFKPEEIYSVHKDKELGSILIKFKNENLMRTALQATQPVMSFTYGNGSCTEVTISEADNSFKYVRVFNLPPEIDDKEIYSALSQYGTIRQQVRERYHQDTGFPVFSTVRGLYMEINKEIPPQIRIRHFQARIYYDGLVNKCFICRSPDHVKQNCPRKAAPVTKTPAQARLYSDVAAVKTLLPRFLNRPSPEEDACRMTTLVKQSVEVQPPTDASEPVPNPAEEPMEESAEQAETLTTSPPDQPAAVLEKPDQQSTSCVPLEKNAHAKDQDQGDDVGGKWEQQHRKGRAPKRSESVSPEADASARLLLAQSRRGRSRSQRRERDSMETRSKSRSTSSTQQPAAQPNDQIFKKPLPPTK